MAPATVITALEDWGVAEVVTVNSALVSPWRTVTVAGTVATPVLLLDRFSASPPTPAGPLSVRRAVNAAPPAPVCVVAPAPARLVGFLGCKVSVTGSAGVSVSAPILVTPRPVAVMVKGVRCETGDSTATLKLADLAPAATVTEAGLLSKVGWLLDSVTITPPAGAGPTSETDPTNDVGGRGGACSDFNTTRSSAAEGTLMTAVWLTLLAVALTLTATDWEPGVQRKVIAAELAPAGTVTLGATLITAGMLLESCTTCPAAGAGAFSVTLPDTLCVQTGC